MLSFLALEDPTSGAVRDRIAHRLAQDGREGGIGRGGINYTFDSAMALSGLLAHHATGGQVDTTTLDRPVPVHHQPARPAAGCRPRDFNGPHTLERLVRLSPAQDDPGDYCL